MGESPAAGQGARTRSSGAAARSGTAALGRALNPGLPELQLACISLPLLAPAALGTWAPTGFLRRGLLPSRLLVPHPLLLQQTGFPLCWCCSGSYRALSPSNTAQGFPPLPPPALGAVGPTLTAPPPHGRGVSGTDPQPGSAGRVRPVHPADGPCPARPAVLLGRTPPATNGEARRGRGRAPIGGEGRRSRDLKLE